MCMFSSLAAWSLISALVAGVLAFAGFLLFNFNQILGPKDSDEIQAWARFSAVMGSLAIAGCGLIIGAIVGIIRARKTDAPTNQG